MPWLFVLVVVVVTELDAEFEEVEARLALRSASKDRRATSSCAQVWLLSAIVLLTSVSRLPAAKSTPLRNLAPSRESRRESWDREASSALRSPPPVGRLLKGAAEAEVSLSDSSPRSWERALRPSVNWPLAWLTCCSCFSLRMDLKRKES